MQNMETKHMRNIDNVFLAVFSTVGFGLAKVLAVVDWHGVTDAALKSAAWALGGLIVTHGFHWVAAKLKDKK